MEAGGEGVSEVVVTGRFRFGGGEEEGSRRIGRRGEYRRGGGNALKKNDGTGMRAGVQNRNLTYYRDRV